MDEMDVREEIIAAIAEVVMPEMEGLKAKLAEHEEKLAEHEEKMNEHYSKTPASESKTATSRFSKNKFKLTENEGPTHNRKRYEMALARLNNKNQ
jgi:ABC-type Fe3+-citrate transport system substrate-binding protein